jgi:hypothetical protein
MERAWYQQGGLKLTKIAVRRFSFPRETEPAPSNGREPQDSSTYGLQDAELLIGSYKAESVAIAPASLRSNAWPYA